MLQFASTWQHDSFQLHPARVVRQLAAARWKGYGLGNQRRRNARKMRGVT